MVERTFVIINYVYKNETTQKRGTQIRGKNTWHVLAKILSW